MGIQLFVPAAAAAYWGIWFFGDRTWVASRSDEGFTAYEGAFPLADVWLVGCCLAGAWALIRRSASALLWILLAGSASIYLGLLDVLFNLQHGIYAESGAGLLVEGALNALSLGLGAWGIRFGWMHRAGLLAMGRG